MDSKKSFEDKMGSQPLPYSSVSTYYALGLGNHFSNSGTWVPFVPNVGFCQRYPNEILNTCFVPPPMGFHVPIQPQSSTEESESIESSHSKEECRGQIVDDRYMDRMNFSEKTLRMAFIRKVYSILMVQLLMTTGIIALFCFHDGLKCLVHKNPFLMLESIVIALILLLALTCCESVRRRSPWNIVLLAMFTITYAIVVGTISSFFKAESVVVAAGITVVVCLALTIFSFQTKWDFTTSGGMFFVGFIVLSCLLTVSICLSNIFPWDHMMYSAAAAMVFSFYLVYNTQSMIGCNHRFSISPEEYIFAVLLIYTDVIGIFLLLLNLFGFKN